MPQSPCISPFGIQTTTLQDGAQVFTIWMEDRPGRERFSDPAIQFVYANGDGKDPIGFIFLVKGADGVLEQLGTEAEPIPMELFAAGASEDGMTIVFVPDPTKKAGPTKTCGAQKFWFDAPAEAPAPHRPRR